MRIALIGGLRSGKDTLGDVLIKECGYTRIAFADAIRDLFDEYFPDLPKNPKPREAMQLLGNDFRQIDPNVWINALDRKLQKLGDTDVVLTDVRYPNEVQFCKDHNFIIVFIQADERIRLERCLKDDPNYNADTLHHVSENLAYTGRQYADITIPNEGTLESYYEKIHLMLDYLGVKYNGNL